MQTIADAGVAPCALMVSPRREFRTRPSNTLPEGEQGTDALVTALRRAGATCPVGAGTVSNFTEFNRNPPGQAADFVYFGVSAIVHAADDVSVMETASTYPALIDSAAALVPGKPIWLGPCTIATRHNPYGAGVVANPGRRRIAAAGEDPRQEALFAAAFAVAAAARAIAVGVDWLVLGAPAGPFGLVGGNGRVRPIAAVNTMLAAASGSSFFEIPTTSSPLAAIAFEGRSGTEILLSNLADCSIRVGTPASRATVMLLQSDASWTSPAIAKDMIDIPGYGVMRVRGA